MTKAASLSLHDDLLRCASRRERLLRQIFGVTVDWLSISQGSADDTPYAAAHDRELASFLDANDIAKNRPFNPSTLPSVLEPRNTEGAINKPIDFNRRRHQTPRGDDGPNSRGKDTILVQHTESDKEPIPRGSLAKVALSRPGEGATICPSNPSSLTSDDAGTTDKSALGAAEVKETPGNARAIKSHPEAVQERRSEENNHPEEGGTDEEPGALDTRLEACDNTVGNDIHLTPPNSGRNVYTSEEKSTSDKILKSQLRIAKEEALGGTPATPDEQLKLEEAQSIERSHASSNVDIVQAGSSATATELPSQFIQDTFDDGSVMMDMPSLNEISPSKQRQDLPPQTPGMRNPVPAGIHGDAYKDPTFSRRPPMRIDTSISSTSLISTQVSENRVPAPASETATPNRPAVLSSGAHSPPERMRTRVSSGALRQKSISEILGETPKTAPTPSDNAFTDASKDEHHKAHTPRSALSFASPDAVAFRLRLNELREKERSKLSTVVFVKQQPAVTARLSDHQQGQQSDGDEAPAEERDYFLTYFTAQASTPPRASPLSALLRSAHKTLATSDHYTEIREKQDYRILSKVWEMQNTARWSLRQPERAVEPRRPVSHWDILLGEMKWLRTDFREERKLKIAGAKFLAEACSAWIAALPHERRSLQMKVRPMPVRETPTSDSATPDLVQDGMSEVTDDDLPMVDASPGSAPAAIFSLPPDVFVFGLNKSPVAQKLLLELPCYYPQKDVQDAALHVRDIEVDSAWKTPLVPISKYARGKIVAHEVGPPRKKSRLEYKDDLANDSRPEFEHPATSLAPVEEDVALFNPDNKHIRDRIHAGHAFRPPSEYQMPTKEFFESRQPSQWTVAEDDELRKLVREYAYNWSLISSCLSSRSMFSSGAERRTPWECFERWINLEGLPAEMVKVPYFRTYNLRLQQAQRSYEAHHQSMIQKHGGNPAQIPLRRRSTQPYNVDQRKNMRHIHMVDAMRRQAKKREAALHKQQHVAGLAAMRKATTEPPKTRQPMLSPRGFSRLKHDKQLKAEEQNRILRIQYINAQNAKKAQQQQQQQAGQQGNGAALNRSLIPGLASGAGPNVASAAPHLRGAAPDPARGGPQMQRLMNGQMNGVVPTNGQGMPHAQMQPQMQMQMGQRVAPQMTSEMRMIQEAQRVQAEQQAFLHQQRQQQRHPQQNGHAGSPNMQNLNPIPQNSAAMLASMHGRSSPAINGGQPQSGINTSPRANPNQPQALSSGMTPAVNQIQNQVKIRHPGASPGEISRLTTEQLYRMSQQTSIQQTAMAAAVGNSGSGVAGMQAPSPMQQQAMMSNSQTNMFNQQQYAQYMRSQQASQQRSGSVGNNLTAMNNGSRSATPMVQRTGSAQSNGPIRGPSQSPRAGTVGVAGGQ